MKRFLDVLHGIYTPVLEADKGGDGGGGGGGDDGKGDDKGGDDDASKRTVTMTQADLDALIAREKGRAKKPYSDYDDVKAQLAALQADEEARKLAAMSEAERKDAELAAEKKRADEAEAAQSKTLDAANQRLIRAEFKIAATTANIEFVDDAYRLADMTGVSVDEDGNVIGVADVVKALVESKPFLIAKAPAQPRIIGGPTDQLPRGEKTKEQLLKEAEDKARASGRLEDSAAYAKLKRELAD